jgi:intermembrane space import and assembly protein 40
MYGSELEDDEDEVEEEIRAQESERASGEASAKSTPEAALKSSKEALSPPAQEKATPDAPHRDSQSTTAAETQKAGDEGGDLVPKASYDATSK